MLHEPVMVDEVVTYLAPARGGVFIDCTVGLGGHARALLDEGATRVIGIDRDRAALAHAADALSAWGSQVTLVHADFRSVTAVLDGRGVAVVDGALADLGVSSLQLDTEGRGFSFRRDEPLDMRMDQSAGPDAAELIGEASEATLAQVIFEYGEERYARRIARAIVEARRREPVRTTGQLAAIVRRAIPARGYQRIDPATRTFQAIRIWVNRELEALDSFLTDLARRLRAGGRLAVITFHSLEDRIVKHTLRALASAATGLLRVLTKRPVVPAESEVVRNPRARSAKLRAAERVDSPEPARGASLRAAERERAGAGRPASGRKIDVSRL